MTNQSHLVCLSLYFSLIGIDFRKFGWIGVPGHLRRGGDLPNWLAILRGGGGCWYVIFGVGSVSQLTRLGKPQVYDAYSMASSFVGRLTSNQCWGLWGLCGFSVAVRDNLSTPEFLSQFVPTLPLNLLRNRWGICLPKTYWSTSEAVTMRTACMPAWRYKRSSPLPSLADSVAPCVWNC